MGHSWILTPFDCGLWRQNLVPKGQRTSNIQNLQEGNALVDVTSGSILLVHIVHHKSGSLLLTCFIFCLILCVSYGWLNIILRASYLYMAQYCVVYLFQMIRKKSFTWYFVFHICGLTLGSCLTFCFILCLILCASYVAEYDQDNAAGLPGPSHVTTVSVDLLLLPLSMWNLSNLLHQ